MPDPLMECSKIQSECNAESRTSWPGCSTQCAAWALPLVHSPRKLRNHLMRGFSKLQVLGCTCPRPVGLVASRRSNRRRKRGGLSFGMRRVGPVCGSGLQGGCAPAGHAAGTCCGAREWAHRSDYTANRGMGAHVCPSCGEKTRHGRQVMSEYGSYVTNVRV